MQPFGEAAVLVEVGTSDRAQLLAASLRARPIEGMVEAVPGLTTVLVELDPLGPEPTEAIPSLSDRLATIGDKSMPPGRRHSIPVVYDGPDLEEVAALTGHTPAEVVALHVACNLRVLFCGFAPGWAYLGDLPPSLHVHRMMTPRTSTPPGSVALAGPMTGIYPSALPGGWRVIGHTDVTLFDAWRDPPTLLLPGDRVNFEQVG